MEEITALFEGVDPENEDQEVRIIEVGGTSAFHAEQTFSGDHRISYWAEDADNPRDEIGEVIFENVITKKLYSVGYLRGGEWIA